MIWHIGIQSNKVRVFLVGIVLLSAMLLPAVSVHPSLPKLRLEEVILFGGWMFCLMAWAYSKVFKKSLHKQSLKTESLEEGEAHLTSQATGIEYTKAAGTIRRIVNIIIILLVVSFTLSNIYAVFLRGASFSYHDAMELVTYFKYYLVFALVISVRPDWGEWRFLRGATLTGAFILVGLGFLQNWNLFNSNAWMSGFLNPVHWESLFISNPQRVLGAFNNPNDFGLVIMILLSVLVVHYLFLEKSQKSFPIALLALIAFLINLEYLTISRSALFGIAMIFVISSVWALWRFKFSPKTLVRVGALLAVTLILFVTASSGFLWRVSDGLNLQESSSMLGRYERWFVAGDTIEASPILGLGTQKDVMTSVVDNEFLLYMRRYGIFGLLVYLSVFFVPWILSLLALGKARKDRLKAPPDVPSSLVLPPNLWLLVAYVVLLPAVLFFAFMGGIFYNLQVMTILAILIGFVYNTLIEIKCKDKRDLTNWDGLV